MNAEPIITSEEMTALLGRDLSSMETTNYGLYLDIAISRLEGLIGTSLPTPLPVDLKLVLAQVFGLITTEQHAAQNASDGGPVSSKRVEDFSISYDTTAGASWSNFLKTYANIIAKYRVTGPVRTSGRECRRDSL